MPQCSAFGCKSRDVTGERKKGLTFHRFPQRDRENQRKWVTNMNRGDWVPTERSHLCSKHFTADCFDRTGQTVRLRAGAVPTIFTRPKRFGRKKTDSSSEEETWEPKRKRVMKGKRNDEEVDTHKPKHNRIIRTKPSGEKSVTRKFQNKRKVKAKFTEVKKVSPTSENETSKSEKGNGYYDHAYSNEELPKKRIPKPSYKMRIKQEEISEEEDLDISEDLELSDSEYVPEIPLESVKEDYDTSENNELPSDATSTVENKSSNTTLKIVKEEEFDKKFNSVDKSKLVIKDKIIQLPDNRTYFEFAAPKRKVILQIKPTVEPFEIKCQTLEDFICSLKLRHLITSDAQELLEAFGELPEGLLKANAKVIKKQSIVHREEVKKFATLLYLYAGKAYDIVNTAYWLPDKRTVQDRLRVKDFWPGFTKEALTIFKGKITEFSADKICSIMLDSVSIKKQCDYDSSCGRWIGHVDFGGGQNPNDSDEIPLASEILLFTAVGLGSEWKLPFGYFLNNRLSGEELQDLIVEAIHLLEECGLDVRVLVCEGSGSTINMGKLFGCNIRTKTFAELVTSFPHPSKKQRKIHLVFGIQHALILLQNLLADKGILRSSTYGIIKWKFFTQLFGDIKKMKPEIVHFFNPNHIEFYHLQRMIRHCYPSFNSTVSQALELANEMKMEEYRGSEAAANFAADVYRAFDLLNSRNPVTTGEKPPITTPFLAEQLESMTVIGQRLFGLELLSGKRIIGEGRLMSVMLFAFTLKSVSIIASELINEKSLLYITTYRLNMDHSDMVLSSIQRRGGWDGSPTAAEFRQGYKNLLESNMNLYKSINYWTDFDGEDLTIGQGLICPFKRRVCISGYDKIFELQTCSLLDLSTDKTLKARCVIKHISQRLSCVECMSVMLDDDHFIDLKIKKIDVNGIRPSKFITNLLEISERVLKVELLKSSQIIEEELVLRIFCEYLTLSERMQSTIVAHLTEEPHHIVCLIKVIIRTFTSMKLNATKYISFVKSQFLQTS